MNIVFKKCLLYLMMIMFAICVALLIHELFKTNNALGYVLLIIGLYFWIVGLNEDIMRMESFELLRSHSKKGNTINIIIPEKPKDV